MFIVVFRMLNEKRAHSSVLVSCNISMFTCNLNYFLIITNSEMKDVNYVQHTLITCMDVLHKENEDFDGVR